MMCAAGMPASRRRKARFNLRNHATGKRARFDELAGFFRCEGRDKGVFIAEVFVEAVDIGEENDFVRVQRCCQMARCDIGVDVERLAVVARRDGRYDGNVIVVDEMLEVGGVDARDFANATKFGVELRGTDSAAVASTYAHGEVAVHVDGVDQTAIHAAHEHHAHELHGVIGRHTQAVFEFYGHAAFLECGGNVFAAAMHDDWLHPDDF